MKLETALALKEQILEEVFGIGANKASLASGVPRLVSGTSVGVFTTSKDTFGIEVGFTTKNQRNQYLHRLMNSGAMAQVGKAEKQLMVTGHVQAALSTRSASSHAKIIGTPGGPVCPGDSVGHWMIPAGTLGCYVRELAISTWKGALSNNHVFVSGNAATLNDAILAPGSTDGGGMPRDQFATMRNFELLDTAAGAANLLDCAAATVHSRMPANPRIIPGLGVLSGKVIPEADLPQLIVSKKIVRKRGRTSGHSAGTISSTSVNVDVAYPFHSSKLTFDPVLAIRHTSGYKPFAELGDSGSLVVVPTGVTDPTTQEELLDAVGLVFAVTTHRYNKKYPHTTYVIPLERILTQFKVELL